MAQDDEVVVSPADWVAKQANRTRAIRRRRTGTSPSYG